jgi:hypothetical protein
MADPITDDYAVSRLEQIIASQKPASTPWTPVTDYSFEARKAIEGIHPQLIKDVFQPVQVLDAGMGPGHLVHLLRDLGVRAFGFDTQRGGACYGDLAASCVEAIGGTQAIWCRRHFDLVICREVLEHLTIRQLRQAVTNLCALSSRFCYVTTRFANEPDHLLDVDLSDDLDPTHCTMLTQPFLRLLFVLEGFRRRADLEAKMDWQNKGRVLVYERA